MGNWRNRPPRRFFNRQRPPKSPPSYSLDIDFSSPGFCEDGVPVWEKKFCSLIGRVPWQKIVDTKKFMFCSNVLDWDDSAGKQAFENAKDRFWAESNSLPCDISLPDPDIYIDEINWNPDIDVELIRDLDFVYFAPDEEEKDGNFSCRLKKYRNSTCVSPPKGCLENSGVINNSWEGNDNMLGSDALNYGAQGGWNKPDNGKKDSSNIKTDDNPWESTCTWGNEGANNKVQGWNQWDDNNNNVAEKLNNDDNPWGSSTWGNEAVRDNTWGSCDDKWGLNKGGNNANWSRKWDNGRKTWEGGAGFGNNSSYWSQQKSWKFVSGNNPVAHNYIQYSKTHKDRGRRDYGQGNAWGSKHWDNSYNDSRNTECGLSGGGWRTWNENCRKREGSRLTSNESSEYKQDHNQNHSWRGRNTNKRVSFTL